MIPKNGTGKLLDVTFTHFSTHIGIVDNIFIIWTQIKIALTDTMALRGCIIDILYGPAVKRGLVESVKMGNCQMRRGRS